LLVLPLLLAFAGGEAQPGRARDVCLVWLAMC
jgi:hypothetical protein